MNKSFILIAATLVLGLCALTASAQVSPNSCSLATLRGTYAWASVAMNLYSGPNSSSGMESYDGRGNVKYYQKSSDGITQSTYIGTATYTITANCIATVLYDGDTDYPYTFFVAPDGSAFYWNNNQGFGQVSAARNDRITRALLVQ